MKLRFSSLDLQVIAHELSETITNYRLSNIYDLTSRIFLLKFAKPESKHLLLIDSGFRCHLTSFSRATATTPSSFVARLRKCLRTRRATKVRQLGTDRVLEIEFSAGEFRLYLEFYAGGNVVLVDKAGVIVAVLRIVKGGVGGVGECKVGAKYEPSNRVAGEDLKERVVEALKSSLNDGEEEPQETARAGVQGAGKKFKKKKRKKGEDFVKNVLSARMSEFSPTLIEHCFRIMGVDPDLKAEEALRNDENLALIVRAFEKAEDIIKNVLEDKTGEGIRGYIIAKQPQQHSNAADEHKRDRDIKKVVSFGSSEAVEEEQQVEKVQEEGEGKGMVYEDFFPFLPKQFEDAPGVKCLEFRGFNHTVDNFYSSIESQKLASRITERELAASKRLASAQTEHTRRVEGLRNLQELNVLKAQAIEANLDRVEEVIAAVNGLVAQGMDWVAMGHLIEGEQKRGNAVAELIKLPLKLFENTVTIRLSEQEDIDGESDGGDESASEFDDEEEEEEEEGEGEDKAVQTPKTQKPLDIDIDLSQSAYANASLYFSQKKTLLVKESKTIQSSTKALKSTERKIAADLKQGLKQEKELLRPVRQQVWFEKFLFFISSDGYLVLAGRDLQQNEILYKHYFKRGDVYVSADVDGAAMIIIKNSPATPGAPIPPSTLSQAGTMAVATSKAWESKSVMSAWWVGYEQVGKMAIGGDYLAIGVFNIKGRKSYLPPAQLVLGYGVLWMIDEEGRKRHGKHRMEGVDKTVGADGRGEGEEVAQGASQAEGKSEERDEDDEGENQEEQEDSDDEEFPDAKIESAEEEEEEEEVNGKGTKEGSDDEGFPDANIEEDVPEPEDASEGEQEEEAVGLYESAVPSTVGSRTAIPSSSKHLSLTERKELRKACVGGGTALSKQTVADIHSEEAASGGGTKPMKAAPKPEQKLPTRVRGKKGKQKKLATKYAHQDDEDRALAMEVLGSASAGAKAEEAATAKLVKEAELAAQKARRREQHARAAREGLKAEEARRRENPSEKDEDEDPSTKVPLDCFVGMPMQGDNLLEAIPVCAPWGAMGKFKYKAKMQPGNVKKGKAVKDVVGRWLTEGEKKMDLKSLDVEKMWPRERELIKGWKEAEIINCVGVSKVKVFGGSAGASGTGKSSGGGKRGGRGGKRK